MHPGQPPVHAPDNSFAGDETVRHRNAPVPDPAFLYGLVGEVARSGSKGNESNPYAITTNYLAYFHAPLVGENSCKSVTPSITRGFSVCMWGAGAGTV